MPWTSNLYHKPLQELNKLGLDQFSRQQQITVLVMESENEEWEEVNLISEPITFQSVTEHSAYQALKIGHPMIKNKTQFL